MEPMTPLIRQRLVGTLVLIALGIVFWPIIFVDPHSPKMISVPPMPEEPIVDTSELPSPETYDDLIKDKLPKGEVVPPEQQALADAQTLVDDQTLSLDDLIDMESLGSDTQQVTGPSDAPLIDDSGFPIFWVLQVATLSSESRANEIVEQLRSKGFKAFQKGYFRMESVLFRVQIGPNVGKAKLLSIKPAVDNFFGVDSKILRYVQIDE